MFKSFKRACLAVLAVLLPAVAQATVVLSTPSLYGYVSLGDFATNSFSATFRDLNGSVSATALPDGYYAVSGTGAVAFTGHSGTGGTVGMDITSPLAIFTGGLSSSGITAGTYNFAFTGGKPGINDTALGTFGFSVNYNGKTSNDLLFILSALTGFKYTDPSGAGTLSVNGTIYSDGAVVSFTESNLVNWDGFSALLAAADEHSGGGNGTIDGPFALSNVVVTAQIPEPAPLALIGLALAGLALVRRRKS